MFLEDVPGSPTKVFIPQMEILGPGEKAHNKCKASKFEEGGGW